LLPTGTVRPVTSTPNQDPSDDAVRVLGSLLDENAGEPDAREAEWAALVGSIAERDPGALRELYERTHRIAFTLIVRILKDPPAAEEVTLDVYQGVWERATTYDPARGSVVAWIMNQARSRAIDRLRHERRKKRVDDGTTYADGTDDSGESAREDQRLQLHHALESLTADERRAIETAYFDEQTYEEVAIRFGTPLGTIKTRIRSGLAKLRKLLQSKEDL
jgi:RNA polymerase sigma-70 factor, ECF subfamily